MTSTERLDRIIGFRVQYERAVSDFIASMTDAELSDLIRESRDGGHGPLGFYIAERLEQALGGRRLAERMTSRPFDDPAHPLPGVPTWKCTCGNWHSSGRACPVGGGAA